MGELATMPVDLERYRKDGFRFTNGAMVDRVTGVIDKIESSEKMKFKDWVLPGSSLETAALDLARALIHLADVGRNPAPAMLKGLPSPLALEPVFRDIWTPQ